MTGFLFGGNTDLSYEQLQSRRRLANQLVQGNMRTPRNVGEGLNAIGRALAARAIERRTDEQEGRLRRDFDSQFASLFGGNPSTQNTTASAPSAMSGGLPSSLIQSESGGDFAAYNDAPGSGGVGHFGRGQFSQGRLQDAMNAGVIPQGTTPDQFIADPQMQQAVEGWHVGDVQNFITQNGLDRFVGQTINGTQVTPQGMLAVAHLGGNAGLQRFLESGGEYNPSDVNGTSLMDYLGQHGGGQPTSVQGSGGPDATRLAQLLAVGNNPMASPMQRQLIEMLMQQRMQQSDPMRQLQLERAQVGLEQDRFDLEQARAPDPELREDAQGILRDVETGDAVFEQDEVSDADALSRAQDSLSLIQAVRDDPNLHAVTGSIQGRLPGFIDQDKQNLLVRIEQLQGRAFLEAFESLKGGGQITEREGQAAQAAIARLQRTQSPEAFQEALDELGAIMQRVVDGGAAPEGIDAELWQYLSPEERALWSN